MKLNWHWPNKQQPQHLSYQNVGEVSGVLQFVNPVVRDTELGVISGSFGRYMLHSATRVNENCILLGIFKQRSGSALSSECGEGHLHDVPWVVEQQIRVSCARYVPLGITGEIRLLGICFGTLHNTNRASIGCIPASLASAER